MKDTIDLDEDYKVILLGLYPDKKIVSFQQHRKLYQEIRRYAIDKGLNLKQYIISLGFEYNHKTKLRLYSENDLIAELDDLYPDKIVVSLQEHIDLYRAIRKCAVEKNLTLEEFLFEFGFEYIRKNHVTIFSEIELTNQLKILYPDNIIGNLSEIQDRNNDVYASIITLAKEKNLDKYGYLYTLGYLIKNDSVRQSNIIYDTTSLLKLKKEYNFNGSKLAQWLGITKQNLDQKISRKRDLYPYWQNENFNSNEIAIINSMIDNKLTCYEDLKKKIAVNIYKSNSNQNCAILSIEDYKIKCLFHLPRQINEKLIQNGFNKYDSKDFDIINELNLNSDLVSIDDSGILEVKISDKKLDSKISSSLARKNTEYGSNKIKYLEFLGFKIRSGNIISDDEILELLGKYKYKKTNILRIPIDDSEYHRIINLAHRRGFNGVKDFIQHYGYEYKRFRTTNYIENVKEQIKQHYVVYDDKIYIHPIDPLYSSLSQYAAKNGQKIDNFLNSLGFIRLRYDALPEGYVPFDWAKQQNNKIDNLTTNDDLVQLLDDRIIQGNQLFISSYEPLYRKLYLDCCRCGTTIDQFLKSLGYERIYANDLVNETEDFDDLHDTDNQEEILIGKSLLEIKSIQSQLESSTTIKEQVQRSSQLADAMKKLYNYRCQLCCPNENGFSSPLIEIKKDKFYVELHHIIHVSMKDKVNDDSRKKLDTYENVVVVCPHHHKYLHYHHGGFNSLVKDQNGVIYFISENGDKLPVYIDYHLKYREDIKEIHI